MAVSQGNFVGIAYKLVSVMYLVIYATLGFFIFQDFNSNTNPSFQNWFSITMSCGSLIIAGYCYLLLVLFAFPWIYGKQQNSSTNWTLEHRGWTKILGCLSIWVLLAVLQRGLWTLLELTTLFAIAGQGFAECLLLMPSTTTEQKDAENLGQMDPLLPKTENRPRMMSYTIQDL